MAPALRPFEILSNTARTLLGTLYMPKGRFVVNSNAILADRPAYTVIIARKVELNGNPTLVLNANYNDTDVPCPRACAPAGRACGSCKGRGRRAAAALYSRARRC